MNYFQIRRIMETIKWKCKQIPRFFPHHLLKSFSTQRCFPRPNCPPEQQGNLISVSFVFVPALKHWRGFNNTLCFNWLKSFCWSLSPSSVKVERRRRSLVSSRPHVPSDASWEPLQVRTGPFRGENGGNASRLPFKSSENHRTDFKRSLLFSGQPVYPTGVLV